MTRPGLARGGARRARVHQLMQLINAIKAPKIKATPPPSPATSAATTVAAASAVEPVGTLLPSPARMRKRKKMWDVRVGDLVEARYREESRRWKPATVVSVDDSGITVVFDGFSDWALIPAQLSRIRAKPAAKPEPGEEEFRRTLSRSTVISSPARMKKRKTMCGNSISETFSFLFTVGILMCVHVQMPKWLWRRR